MLLGNQCWSTAFDMALCVCLQVSNRYVKFRRAEQDTITNNIRVAVGSMSGSVFRNGIQGADLIEEMGSGVIIDVHLIVQDPSEMLPGMRATVDVPRIHARITDKDYVFILATLEENFSEMTRIPPEAFNWTVKVYPEALQLQFKSGHLDGGPVRTPLQGMGSLREDQVLKSSDEPLDSHGNNIMQAHVRVGSAQLTLLNAQVSFAQFMPNQSWVNVVSDDGDTLRYLTEQLVPCTLTCEH